MCSPQIILDKIVEKIVESVIQSVVCHIRFVCCYKGSLEKLDAEKKNLEEQRQKVNDEVDRYKTLGEDIEANVSNWQTEADNMINEVEEFLNNNTDKESMQCFKFSCPDYISRYKLSKQAERKIVDIKNLTQKGKFDKVSHRKPPPQKLLFPSSADFVSLDYRSFNSRESVFKRIMDALKDSKVYKIGVHGLGGVGKTKMVEEVGKQVKKDGLFDEVVMAVVSQDANVRKIQLQLVGGLNPKPDVATINDEHERAKELWLRLDNGKKNLIILDDIWHELSLDTIGIPIKGKNKVVITSRNRDVWKNMEMDTEMQIKVLSETEAWALFKKKVGNSVDSPELHAIAKEVCKECQGLPLAILVLGGALKGKEEHVWKNALEKLKKCMLNKIEGISPKLYESMKLSYDYLSMDAKSCFLLCCMFPEDAQIPIDELVRHCMARRLLVEKQDTLEKARDAVLTVVNTLKTCSLFLDDTNKNVVKMHDVIRDVAVSIADDEKAILVKHGVHEWPEEGTYESYLAISLRSKTVHEVPNKLRCSQLHTLLLECIAPLVIIPDMFFDGMEKLTVLELNGVRMLQLPPSLANLVNLRMLCLNECQLEDITILKDLKNKLEVLSLRGSDIKALPSEIGQLTQLRLLDLRYCKKLSKIPQGVISNLSCLEELYILDSFVQWEDATANKERSNVSLDELRNLTQLTTLHLCIPNAMLLPKDICFENLIRFIISTSERFDYCEYQSSFKLVGVPFRDEFNVLLERAEVLDLEKVEGLQKVYHRLYPSGSFNKLTELTIEDCKLKYLFSPSCARGLLQIQQLVIRDCAVMEGIVGNEGEKNEEAVTSEAINFSQLKDMELRNLPSLVCFYPKMEKTSTAKENSSTQAHSLFNEKVTFPALEEFCIDELPKLTEIWDMKLPPSESFKELWDVSIWSCEKLVNVGLSNMPRQLPKLRKLLVAYCQELKVVLLENGEENEKAENNTNTILFPQLTGLSLIHLESLKSFCTSRSERQSLFTSQVAFPVLEDLKIQKLPNIIEIWEEQLLIASEKESKSFCQLKDMKVSNCEKLVHVGQFNMLTRLQNLKKFNVDNCPRMEAIVLEKEKEERTTRNDIIVFSQLRTLNLSELVSLKSFCNGPTRSEAQPLFNHQVAFPVLEALKIQKLPNIIEIWEEQLLIASEKESKSFCQLKDMKVSNCEKLVHVGQFNMLPRLQNLKKFNVDNCPRMEAIVSEKEKEERTTRNDIIVFSQLRTLNLSELVSLKSFCNGPTRSEAQPLFNHQVAFPVLKDLEIQKLPNIIEIWDEQLLIASEKESKSFCQLKDMKVSNCEKLVHVVQFNMLPRLQNLKTFNIDNCPRMEAIVSEKEKEEGTTRNDIIVFSQLTTLNLSELVSLKSFCNGPTRSEAQPLFDPQVAFPVLEDLKIHKLPNIIEIWDEQLLIASKKESKSFCQLKDMKVSNCEKLVHVGQFNMLPRLQNLKKFNVDNCPRMEAIVSEKEKEERTTRNDIIVFSQLTTLNLSELVSLKSFCNGPTRSEAQPLFNHQVAFPVLEYLKIQELPNIIEIWDKQLLIASEEESKSFCQLKYMTVSNCEKLVHVVQFNMLSRLQNLETFNVDHCPKMEAIVSEKEKEEGTTSNDIIVFSQLTTLNLSELVSLKSFYNWSTRSEAQPLFNHQVAFPVLEDLEIHELPNIIDIWDKQLLIASEEESKSFCQLKDMTVSNCGKLVHVVQFNMLSRLQNLETFNVDHCPKMEAIVSEKGKQEGTTSNDIIVFSQLTTLNLSKLVSLKSFYNWPTRSEAQPLFNHQVSFPKLETLFLDNCANSREIHPWNVQAGKISLKFLDVANLDKLIVRNCSEVAEVFQLEGLNVGEGQHVRPLIEVRMMELDGLPQLTCLWNKDPHGILGLQSLQYLTIKKCSLLRNLFTCSTAMALQQLKVLYLESCPVMEEVIATTEDGLKEVIDVIEFPKLEGLILKDLPNLNSFCNANYNFNLPSLKRVVLKRCPDMHNFTLGQVRMSQIFVSTRGNEGLQTEDLNKYLEERLLKGEECGTVDESDSDIEEEEFSNLYFLDE